MPIDLDKLSDRVNRMTEQREAASAPPAPEPSIWQRASEALDQAGAEATGYGEENVPAESWEAFGTGAVDKAEAFGNLISNTYRDVSEARKNMLDTQQELTAAYTPDAVDEANSTGDYSMQEASVANMQEAGSTFAVSPFKESTREFISAYAEDNDSSLQGIAQNLRRSTANVEYFMNPAEKIAKARDIEEATGIPSSAILSDTDAYKNALEIYDFTQKQRNAVKGGPFNMQKVYDEYPELKSLAELSPQDAALALHDMKSVRSAHGIIDAFTKSLEYGNEKLEYDNLQYKIMQGTATENDKQRAEDLKKKLEHDVSLPSFFDDPLMYVASGVAGSAPEMGQSLVYMAHDAAVGALAGMAAGAAVGAVPGAGVGLVAGSIGNVFRGYVMRQAAMQGARVAAGAMGRYGMFRGMYAPEAGDRYAQNKEMTDEKGNPLLSEQAAKDYATVGGALNAGIEMADFGLVLKTMKGNPAAEQVVKSIVGRAQAESGARAALTDALTKQAGGMLKVTAAETGEEGLQQISDDLIHNDIEDRTGDTSNGGVYSASKLAANAFVAMGQALPASLGFGVVSAGTGTVSGASGLARHIQKLTNEQTKFDQLARETMTGAVMVGRLQEAVKVSQLNQLAPDVQERILRDQLSGTKFETAYVDTESAMASESGREDIEKVAGKAGYSKEDIETAIAEKGTIAVPLEKYAQSEASPNLLNSVTFSNEAEPMAKMQAAAKEASEAYAKTMQKAAERQKRLTDIVTKELFPVDGEERQTAQAVLLTDPQNPARGWRQLQKEMQAKRMEILQPAINALKAGMKQGVDIITDDSGRGTRVSNNDEWYRDFYAKNKRAPREAELEDMARDMVTGAESAPKVLGWIPTSEEEQQAFAESQAELKEAEDTLFVLDRIKGRMTDMNGVEMEITEGMSPEAYGVYRNMLENLKAGPGMSVRAARVGALLFARHADIVAPKIAKATGKKFTAKDYYEKKFELDLNGKYRDMEGLRQVGMDPNIKIKEQRKLEAMEPIPVESYTIHGENSKKAIAAAREWFANKYPNGTTVNTLIGNIKIDDRSIKNSFTHGVGQKKLDVVPTLYDGLKNAAYAGALNDFDNKESRNHFFVYKVQINGETNYVICRIKENYGHLRLYIHEVASLEEIKKKSDALQTRPADSKNQLQPRGIALYISILSDFLNVVNKDEPNIYYQFAYHGSPHNFNEFSIENIGAGQGAQAHGWGLYFAKDKKIASSYRETLTWDDRNKIANDNLEKRYNGKTIQEWYDDFGAKIDTLNPASHEFDVAREKYGLLEEALLGEDPRVIVKEAIENEVDKGAVRWFKKTFADQYKEEVPGMLLRADIPNNSVLLNEEKNFADQPRKVKAGIDKMLNSLIDEGIGDFGQDVHRIGREQAMQNISRMFHGEIGKNIYGTLVNILGSEKDASIKLNEYGIKGIVYDGKDDGRCFVVFDDQAISIIEKYNQGPLGSTSLLSDGRRAISLFENANESTFLHEMGHMFLMDLEDLSKDDLESAKELAAVEDWAEWKKGMSDEYADTPWSEEFKKMEQTIINAEEAGDVRTAENEKLKWKNERFARGFERYLHEGKAPAKGLRPVFRKFRSFLVQLYQTILGDGSKPSREVEAVMARMIATDEEINEAAITDTYKDVEKAGGDKLLGESEKETRERWHDKAMAEARENLTKIVMQDYEKEKQNEVQHRLTAERQKKKDELMQNDKIYVARQAVEDSKDPSMALAFGYENVAEYEKENKEKPSLEEAVDAYMDEYARALDKEMLQQHMTPQAVREAIESSKYHKKLVAMEAAAYERKAMLIKKITSKAEKAMQGVAEKLDALPDHTDMVADKEDGRVKDVLQALNKLRFSARWSKKDFSSIDAMMKGATKEEIASALKEFQKESAKQQTGLKELERATEGKMKIFEALARESVRGKKLADALSVATYERNEKRAEKNALKMAHVGKWDLAAQQKQSAAMSAAMAHEARKMIGETNALLDKAKKMLNTKVRVTKNERYWYRHLAYLLRIAPQDIAKPQDLMSLSNLVTMMKENHTLPDDYEPSMIMEKSQEQNFAGWRSLTYPELEEAVDILTILYTSGRDAYNMKTVSGKTIDDVMDEIVTDNSNYVGDMQVKHHYSTNDEGGMGSIAHLRFLSRMNAKNLAMHFKPEVMLRIIGEKAHRYIYGTYERAAEKEGEMRWEAIHQLKKILSAYTHKERQGWKKRQFDFNGDKKEFSKENIICMALNMGNDINFRRLYMSHNVDETTMREFVYKNMTKKDWQLVQKIWDLVGSYWKETVEVEETLNGVQLKGVEARPFQVIMPDGEVVKLRGGYYPIIYNPDKSQRAADLSANAELKSQMSGAAVLGSGRGFTKSRSEADISRPLLLKLDGITAHLDAVAHNIAYRVAARDVYRLVNDARFVQHVTETLGTQYYSALHNWATDVWSILPADNGQTGKEINRAIGYLRRNAVMAIMGYRVWPVVENLSNIGPVMDKLGPVKAATAISHFYANRAESMKLLNRSVFMRNRINSMDRDIRSQPGLFNATSRPMEIIRDHAYTMMTYSDLMLSAPLWVQAYRDSFADKVREVAAENEENKNAVVKAQAEYDAARAAAIDIYTKRKAVRDEISLRNRGLRDNTSAYHGWSLEDLNAEDYNITEQGKEASKKEWEADTRLQLAAETQLLTDDEIEKEAKKRSVMAADAVIRDTFGSGEVKDQAGIQRSRNELYKVATTFYSFFNTQFNAIVIQYYKGKANGWEHIGSWAPLARSIMCRLIVMSLIGSVLKMLTKTDGDDDKDKYRTVTGPDGKKQKEEIGWNERFMKVFAKNLLQTGTGSLAFLRDLAGYAINKYFDGTDYGRGINPFATSTAGFQQAAKAIDLFASMSQKNLEIEEKHAKEAERYAKMTKKQKKKWDEDAVYRKPDKKITYADILKQDVDAGSSFTASYHGLSNTVVNSALTTMQYLNDESNRYDPAVTNILWSAIFNKKPVERETPKKPPAPPKKNKRGNVK